MIKQDRQCIGKRSRSQTGLGMRRVVFAFILAIVMTGAIQNSRAATIGLSLPLGGISSGAAARFLSGAELAVETLGGGHKLFVVDDGCEAEIGGLAADDLADREVVIATGYLCNVTSVIAANRFREPGIPLLIAGARSIRLIKDRDREEWRLWRVSPGDDYAATAAAAALSKRWKNTPYAIIDDGTIYSRNFSDHFRLLMEEAETPPQFVDNFRAAQSTQANLIRRLQRSGVAAVIVATTAAEDVITIAKNLRDFKVPLEIVGGETLDILPWLEDAADVPAGLLMIKQAGGDLLESAAGVVALLEERDIELDALVFEGYAALQIALAAIGKNHQQTVQNLRDMTFDTILGEVKFDADGKNTQNRFVLHVWNGDALLPVETLDKAGASQ